MAKNSYELNDSMLLQEWQTINKSSQQPISIQKLQLWLAKVVKQPNEATVSIQEIKQFNKHKLVGKQSDLNISYQQAVNFLNWLTIKHNFNQHQDIPKIKRQLISNYHQQKNKKQQSYDIQQDNPNHYEQLFNEFSNNQQKVQLKQKHPPLEIGKNQAQQNKHEIWKKHLQIIFQHYCKINYGLKQDPTFQQINQQNQFMTVNQFMIFCRDFEIIDLSNINRKMLIDLFKKNSELFKHMALPQFCTIIEKIANLVNRQSQFSINNNNQSLNILLNHLQIDSHSKFRQKMKRMNIHYNNKKSTTVPKKVPQNYEFKYSPKKRQMHLQKAKSERKIKHKFNKMNSQKQQKRIKANSVKSHKIIKPPIEIINSPKPQTNSIKILPKGQIKQPQGYYQIHMLKNIKLNKNDSVNQLKLSNIVQQAKNYIMENQFHQYNDEIYSKKRNTSDTKKRNLSERNQILTPSLSQQMQLLEKDSKKQQSIKYLSFLLQDQDEDEYLKMHLSQQRSNNFVSRRIQKIIKNLQK